VEVPQVGLQSSTVVLEINEIGGDLTLRLSEKVLRLFAPHPQSSDCARLCETHALS
jgi:hypothetical protein